MTKFDIHKAVEESIAAYDKIEAKLEKIDDQVDTTELRDAIDHAKALTAAMAFAHLGEPDELMEMLFPKLYIKNGDKE
mgnify:FL=1